MINIELSAIELPPVSSMISQRSQSDQTLIKNTANSSQLKRHRLLRDRLLRKRRKGQSLLKCLRPQGGHKHAIKANGYAGTLRHVLGHGR